MTNKEIGRKIKNLRSKRRFTLRGLSRETGIAVSFLSSLEQGKNSVSVAKLKTILDALGTDLGTFFATQKDDSAKIVYSKNELTEIAGLGKGLSFKEVASGRPNRKLQLIRETYSPGADTGPDLYRHNAEEAGIVLKGTLELTVEDNVYELNAGDAYYFSSRRPHRVRNIGKGKAESISVNTPPSF